MKVFSFDLQRFANFNNSTANSLVGGTNDNDSIYNNATGATLKGLGGNDSVRNGAFETNIKGGDYVLIDTGDEEDFVYNMRGVAVTVNAGDGNDQVHNYVGASLFANLGDGNDSLNSYNGANITVFGGYGNDSIINQGVNSSIQGDDGDDILGNSSLGTNSTLDGGEGNDYIWNNTKTIIYGGDDDDTVYNNSQTSGSYVNVGAGKDSVWNGGDNVTIFMGSGNDTVYNSSLSSGATIDLGSGKDFVRNIGDDAKLYGGNGNDTLENWGNNVTIDAGAGNDTVYVSAQNNSTTWGKNVSAFGGAGNDLISLSGNTSGATIRGGKGNDTIYGSSLASHLFEFGAGDGRDVGYNSKTGDSVSLVGDVTYISTLIGSDFVVSLTSGDAMTLKNANDVIISGGRKLSNGTSINSSINGTALSGTDSNDTITNYGWNVTIDGGKGHDKLNNYGTNVSILGGADNDTIFSKGTKVSINTGAGADSVGINSNSSNVTILTGDDDDSINNWGNNSYINTGNDNDYVHNSSLASNNTILTGAGNDSVVNRGLNVSINTGTGDDSIYNGTGNNITLAGGEGNDTINNRFAQVISIDAGIGDDSIYGNNNYATITGGAGKDTIIGNHWRSSLSGDDDNDLISLTSYWYNTLDGGEGNDTIIAGGNVHSVNGGAGNDLISLSGSSLTVRGGKGNDTIYGNSTASHLYGYDFGDGVDTIYGYNDNDSIFISGGKYSSTTSGQDVVIKVKGSESIILAGAKGKQINITGTEPEDEITAQEVIKKLMYSFDTNTTDSGRVALDKAIDYASNGYFKNWASITNQMVADCKNLGAEEFLKKCGIDLTNTDTGAITGADAGTETVKTAESVVPEEGSLDTSFNYTSFTTENGLTFRLEKTYLSSDELYMWQALKTWWAEEGLNLIKDSYDYSFLDENATVKEITVVFEEDYSSKSYLAYTDYPQYINGRYTRVLGINKAYYYNFLSDDVNGASPRGQEYLDRTIAHELTHAVMMAKLNNFGDLPQFITEGMAELTHGIDDARKPTIESLANDFTKLEESLSLTPGTGDTPSYAGGYMFLRYLAKQSAEHYSSSNLGSKSAIDDSPNSNNVTVNGSVLTVSKNYIGDMLDLADYSAKVKTVNAKSFSNGIMISGNKNANSIAAGAGNDSIFANAGKDTLRGGKGDDILYGEAGNDKLYGDSGNDSLNGGSGNDTLTGGDGSDVFIFGRESGKDLIADYTSGQDKIKIVDGGITSASINGSNLILEAERAGIITIKNGKDKKITVIDESGAETTKKYSDATKIINVTNSTKSPVTISSSIQGVDASARTTAVKITGNKLSNTLVGGSKNDSIYGGNGDDNLVGHGGKDKLYGQAGNDMLYGGAGNDSLWGGAGNDSLWGCDGKDVFTYKPGEGTDTIFDYESGDMLRILKANGKVGGSFTDSAFSGNELTLTINGGGSVIFAGVNNGDKFNINGKTYTLGASKLK